MAKFGYRFVTSDDVGDMVNRLTRPTKASHAWNYRYDAQAEHIRHLKTLDPKVHCRSRSVTPQQLDDIVGRLHRPTIASTAKEFDFSNQDANLYFLKARDERVLLPFRSLTPSTLRGMKASRNELISGRSSTVIVEPLENGGSSRRSQSSPASDGKTVTSDELDGILNRLTKPTVSTLGGAPLAMKKYEYIPIPKLKTLPDIPGLDTKYVCDKKVSQGEFEGIVTRLTKPTKATASRSAADPHTRVILRSIYQVPLRC